MATVPTATPPPPESDQIDTSEDGSERVEPRPSEVKGYAQALRLGQIPLVPRLSPPEIQLRPTARTLSKLRTFIWSLVGVVLLVATVVWVVRRPGYWFAAMFFVPFTLISLWMATFPLLSKAHRAWLEEIMYGYTTMQKRMWVVTSTKRKGSEEKDSVIEDLATDGVWKLNPDGSVDRGPQTTNEPPGYYPSPHRDNSFELWTGTRWGRIYRSPRKVPPRGPQTWTGLDTGDNSDEPFNPAMVPQPPDSAAQRWGLLILKVVGVTLKTAIAAAGVVLTLLCLVALVGYIIDPGSPIYTD